MKDLHAIIEELLVLEDEVMQQKLAADQNSLVGSVNHDSLADAQKHLNEALMELESVAEGLPEAPVDMPERIDEAMHRAAAYSEKYER